MAGRAYIDDGDKKAANFIRNELRNNGAKLMGDNGFQTVDISVNNILDAKLKFGKPIKDFRVGVIVIKVREQSSLILQLTHRSIPIFLI